ncbi:MAG TPA: hypothetical protein VH394_28510 [Thermoanaerobaculia bacterium]|jgi:hypothetical protein|nr:hypothetical protein [Thermoanaerobaculia bacterium]
MRGLCRPGIIALLALAFGALPFTAAADAPSCGTANVATPLWMARPGGGGGGVTAQTTCVADCGNGTSVSTLCGGTCTATDVNCPYNRGYVTCNGVYTYCSNTCSTAPPCDTVEGAYCSGGSTTCSRSDGDYPCNCVSHHWLCAY